MSMQTIVFKILALPGIIIGLSFHEFAHAWVSDRLGDPTPRRQGRVTLNPMAHIDWVGFIALVLIGFGWGKPVQIDPSYYKKRRRDQFLVSIAGVVMNLLVAIVFTFIARGILSAYYVSGGSAILENLYYIIYYTVNINIVLMIFNLIPCPPLDGWNIITQIFKLDRYSWWYKVYQYGTYILLALIIFNVTSLIISPAVSAIMGLLGF